MQPGHFFSCNKFKAFLKKSLENPLCLWIISEVKSKKTPNTNKKKSKIETST